MEDRPYIGNGQLTVVGTDGEKACYGTVQKRLADCSLIPVTFGGWFWLSPVKSALDLSQKAEEPSPLRRLGPEHCDSQLPTQAELVSGVQFPLSSPTAGISLPPTLVRTVCPPPWTQSAERCDSPAPLAASPLPQGQEEGRASDALRLVLQVSLKFRLCWRDTDQLRLCRVV